VGKSQEEAVQFGRQVVAASGNLLKDGKANQGKLGEFIAGKNGAGSGAIKPTGLLPISGNSTTPVSKGDANSEFIVDSAQLGKKLGKHVEDFGGSASSEADRQLVLNRIHEIANNPDKIIPGTFSGQGDSGTRGDVFFRIKDNDVIVTKPNGTFITILKDGVVNNTSVKNALQGKY